MRESGLVQQHITWTPRHYVLCTTVNTRYGTRQIGYEWLAVCDDFGALVLVKQHKAH